MSEAITLGPFTGGYNGSDNQAGDAIAANELVVFDNLEVALDGSLQVRPPIRSETTNGPGSVGFTVIGSAVAATGSIYMIGVVENGGLYYSTDHGATWTLIVATLQARVALQYNNIVYVPANANSAVNGGRWDLATLTWTTDASMPKAEAGIFYKSRLFLVPGKTFSTGNTSRLQWTDVITAAALVWGASNFIDVSPGDGQKLVDLCIYNDNIMLFKESSTFVLAYDNSISNAVLRELNTNIGCSEYRCMVTYENSVYIMHDDKIYEIVNYNFERLNTKVPFRLVDDENSILYPTFLSIIGDRLVVKYYNFNYVFGLLTRTWSRWSSESIFLQNFGPWVEVPAAPSAYTFTKYIAGSAFIDTDDVYGMWSGAEPGREEMFNGVAQKIVASMVTGYYDFGNPHVFKKLFWWGADITSSSFDSVKSYARGSASEGSAAQNTVTGQGTRKFYRFLPNRRFRKIQFSITLDVNGVSTDTRRIHNLTAMIGSRKQGVEARVTN